jgi:hemolysin activation/secretion protein
LYELVGDVEKTDSKASKIAEIVFVAFLSFFVSQLLFFSPAEATAQSVSIRRPEQTRPALPDLKTRGNVLPPIKLQEPAGSKDLGNHPRFLIHKVIITGATVLAQADLDKTASDYIASKKNQVTVSDLMELRDWLTMIYLDAGYVSSGAVIESIRDGVVSIRIYEGMLETMNVKTDGRLKQHYIRNHFRMVAKQVINQNQIAKILQNLQQNPRIRSVKAALKPGNERGRAVLEVNIYEAKPYRMGFQFDNLEAPSVGAYQDIFTFSHLNISGYGDALNTVLRRTQGLSGLRAMYELPVTASGTTLELHVNLSEDKVVEAPFDELDMEGESETYGFTVTHPLYHHLNTHHDHRFDLFLTGEHRRSQSFLFGQGFGFTEGASDEGESKVTVARIGHNWLYRTGTQALALKNTASIGLDMLDATINESDDIADGQFFAYLGQAQYTRRLSLKGVHSQLIVRADVQWAGDPLLSMEKIGVGGFGTVRGYRQNELVRDNALVGSVEVRIPIIEHKRNLVELAPFFDVAKAWNHGDASEQTKTISGAGLGLRWSFGDRASAFLYWGHNFDEVGQQREYNLQDDGLYFQLAAYF